MKNSFIKIITAMLLLVSALVTTLPALAKDISQAQLQQLMKNEKQVVLLDVRTVEEFVEGHIPKALNIPHKELEARLAELSGKQNTQIIIYCRSGRRAEVAKQVLVKNGFSHLDHLTGDFNGWTSSNLPMETGK
ncbi:MAG: rhodanese-like domain-containing protein [Colwellia sp.]|nr:rhodanese-like domain-containing protein [Colwellia sp.]